MGKAEPEKRSTDPRALRLPDEKTGALVLPPDDGFTPVEKAAFILQGRLKITKQGFFLDGRPANTYAVLDAAGVKLKPKGEIN